MIAYWIIQFVSMAVLTAIVVVAVRRYKIGTDVLTRVLLERVNAAGGMPGVEQDQLPASDAIESSGDKAMQREHPPAPMGRGVETATRSADTRSTWSGLVAGICTTGVLALGFLFWLDWLIATLAVSAGVVIGGVVSVGKWRVSRYWTPAEIRRDLGLPVLGCIPRFHLNTPPATPSATGLDPLLVCFLQPHSPESEAVRGVSTLLSFSTQDRRQQVIQVTSPAPGDGKSTLAANLAISLAQSGKQVVLLDCDFRKPQVHRLFNLPNPEVGLASVMAGGVRLDSAIRECEVPNLSIVPCGPQPANPGELLTSPSFQEILIELRGRYDYVVIDSPPLLAVSDPLVIAHWADGLILVLRVNKTPSAMAAQALERLTVLGARILGVVVNGLSARTTYRYEYQATMPERRPVDTQSGRRTAEDSPETPPPSEPAPSPEHLR